MFSGSTDSVNGSRSPYPMGSTSPTESFHSYDEDSGYGSASDSDESQANETLHARQIIGEGATAKVCVIDENTVFKHPQQGCDDCLRKGISCSCPESKECTDKRMESIRVEQKILSHIGPHSGVVGYLRFAKNGTYFKRAAHGSLHEYVGRVGRSSLSTARLVRWGIQITEDVEVVHASGVRHSDIQPSNFLVDGNEDILICDFSGSYLEAEKLDGLGREAISYCKPFHRKSDVPTVATDIFALGSTLYWLMTGEDPHESLEDTQIISSFERGEFPDTEHVLGGDIIEDCWHGQFESVSEVCLRLRWLQRRTLCGLDVNPEVLTDEIEPLSLDV